MKRNILYETGWLIRFMLINSIKPFFIIQYWYYRYLTWVAIKHKNLDDIIVYAALSTRSIFTRYTINKVILKLIHERMVYLDKIE